MTSAQVIDVRLTGFVLRAMGLLGKFLLLLLLARVLETDALGIFGLVAATVTILVFVVGLEFYNFANRELIIDRQSAGPVLIAHQLYLALGMYLALVIVFGVATAAGLMTGLLAIWIVSLVIVSHLAQEAYRIVVALEMPVRASLALFLRNGLWCYFILLLFYSAPQSRSLESIWLAWIVSSVVAVAVCWRPVMRVLSGGSGVPLDRGLLAKGLRIGAPFLGAALAIQGLQFADRYFLQYFHGEAEVGVYTYFSSIASVIGNIGVAVIAVIHYPKLIRLWSDNTFKDFRNQFRLFARDMTLVSLSIALLITVLLKPLIELTDKSAIGNALSLAWPLLAMNVLYSVSLVANYGLYACRRDLVIFCTVVTAFGLNLAGNAVLVPRFGSYGAACSSLGSVLLLTMLQLVSVSRTLRQAQLAQQAGES